MCAQYAHAICIAVFRGILGREVVQVLRRAIAKWQCQLEPKRHNLNLKTFIILAWNAPFYTAHARLTQLSQYATVVTKHIKHKYSKEMSTKSNVVSPAIDGYYYYGNSNNFMYTQLGTTGCITQK